MSTPSFPRLFWRSAIGAVAVLFALALGQNACGGGGGEQSGTGGTTGGGGQEATGGAVGAGGTTGAGGAVGTGGATGAGGTTGSGGTGSAGTGAGGTTGSGGTGSGGMGTAGSGTGGTGTGGTGTGGTGTGGAGLGGSGAGGAGTGGAAGACATIKINEVLVGTPVSADQELVELYNPCSTPVDLLNYRLVYRSSTTLIDTTVAAFTGGTIPAQGFWLVGSYDPNGRRNTTFALNVHFDAAAGGVGLRNPNGQLVDSVGYGTGVTNQLIEGGLAAQAPPAGQSIGRRPDGRDTGTNVVDFALMQLPTPGTSNL